LLAAVGGEFEYLVELIDSFLTEAPGLLAELEQFALGGDAAGVRRVAHSLKSNGTDLGATAFTEQCKELEEMGKLGDLSNIIAMPGCRPSTGSGQPRQRCGVSELWTEARGRETPLFSGPTT
jgi:HPt (histidine-containing phosphotransfer) domain-containing protein